MLDSVNYGSQGAYELATKFCKSSPHPRFPRNLRSHLPRAKKMCYCASKFYDDVGEGTYENSDYDMHILDRAFRKWTLVNENITVYLGGCGLVGECFRCGLVGECFRCGLVGECFRCGLVGECFRCGLVGECFRCGLVGGVLQVRVGGGVLQVRVGGGVLQVWVGVGSASGMGW